jgi:hypothetical protein
MTSGDLSILTWNIEVVADNVQFIGPRETGAEFRDDGQP